MKSLPSLARATPLLFLTLVEAQAQVVSDSDEGFEDDAVWGGVRTTIVGGPMTAPAIYDQGLTWTGNNPGSEVTTGTGPALTGMYGFFQLPHGDQEHGIGDSLDISNGTSADCDLDSIPDECEIDVNSNVSGGPFFRQQGCESDCNSNGLIDDCELVTPTVFSSGQLGPFGSMVSQSYLVVAPPAPRADGIVDVRASAALRLILTQSNASGIATSPVDLSLPPAAGNVMAGTTHNFHFRYRDASGGPSGFNFSDALEVAFQ